MYVIVERIEVWRQKDLGLIQGFNIDLHFGKQLTLSELLYSSII